MTVIVLDVAEQPAAPTVTEYVPADETVIVCVVAPVLHVLPLAALELNVTLPEAQKVVGPLAVIVGVVGLELTVTVCEAIAEVHPFASK